MNRRFLWATLLLLSASVLVATSAPACGAEDPEPAGTATLWGESVARLSPGQTQRDEVLALFGAPQRVEARPGGALWHYRLEGEGPRSTADGKASRSRMGRIVEKVRAGVERAILYPPVPKRPAVSAGLPSPIHLTYLLEVDFDAEGALRGVRFEREPPSTSFFR